MSHRNNLTLIILVQNMVKPSVFQWTLFSAVGQDTCQVGRGVTAHLSELKAFMKRPTKGWEQSGPRGATMEITVRQGSHCLQPHSHPSWGPRGSTAAQGYVQGQKLFGWLSCISCLNTRSPSTPGTSDWARWKQFLCQIWPMGRVLNYADLVLQCLEPIPLLSKD